MKRNQNPKILADALFKVSEQNSVLDDVNTALIFLNDNSKILLVLETSSETV